MTTFAILLLCFGIVFYGVAIWMSQDKPKKSFIKELGYIKSIVYDENNQLTVENVIDVDEQRELKQQLMLTKQEHFFAFLTTTIFHILLVAYIYYYFLTYGKLSFLILGYYGERIVLPMMFGFIAILSGLDLLLQDASRSSVIRLKKLFHFLYKLIFQTILVFLIFYGIKTFL